MESEDLTAITIYGGGGALCGVVSAAFLCRHRNPMSATAIYSLLGAPLIALSFVAVAGAVESIRRFGINPFLTTAAALSTVFFLIFSLPVVCGVPAVLAGLATQYLLQLVLSLNKDKDEET